MNEVRFRISVSADDFLLYYKGVANSITVSSVNGQVIQLPAGALLKFLDRTGVHGTFRVIYDNNHKLVRVEKVSN